MTEERALQIVEQRTVTFYGDSLMIALTQAADSAAGPVAYVPLKPICDLLGVNWSAQYRRVNRDPVLSKHAVSIAITAIQMGDDQAREMVCLPLDYLSGWLFGISSSRVRPDLRERLIQYQDQCYAVLAEAMKEGRLSADSDKSNTLAGVSPETAQAVQLAQAVLALARNQALLESRLGDRLDNLEERLETVEATLGDSGRNVTQEQASMISQAVKTVALALGRKSGRNEHGSVYGELYRKFSITGYKMLPARRFEGAMRWLTDWHEELTGQGELPF
jgi:hypothetical protein